jgi:predicted dehydrogenase
MNLGVIGYGSRIQTMVEEMLRLEPKARLTAITDPRKDQLQSAFESKGLDRFDFFETPEEMLESAKLDGVLIGTRCSLHTDMALRVFPSGLPLFLEKPVATCYEDLYRLKQGYEKSKSGVVVSFPLRVTPIVQLAKEILDSGKIGTVEHVQAINNVPYGGVYFQNWYRNENETGGLFLQKATHDFDYINYLLGIRPVMVSAMTSKQIFKGDKPAGLQCVDCEDRLVCPESTVLKRRKRENPPGEYCAFAIDTGNEDSGSAMIRYESGMHVTYSQNFFARKQAAARGARLLGYTGTLEFDFVTKQLKVFMHHTNRVETYDVNPGKDNHGGGDTVLAQNFIDVMQGRADSISPLESGLLSVLMCLKAKDSAATNTFLEISWND